MLRQNGSFSTDTSFSLSSDCRVELLTMCTSLYMRIVEVSTRTVIHEIRNFTDAVQHTQRELTLLSAHCSTDAVNIQTMTFT